MCIRDRYGFDHAWTYDHLAWRSLADEPWFATVPLLAAAGAVTERIGLGTWVASPNFRPRVPFVIAANGPRAMALAARYGQGWVTYGPTLADEVLAEITPAQAQELW